MKGFSAKKLMKSVNVENVVIAVLVIVLVVLVVVYVNKNNEQFQTKGVLYFFYVDWCPHCQKAKPIWKKLGDKLSNKLPKLKLEMVNGEENRKLAEKYEIQYFPTILYINGDSVVEYEGERELEPLTNFAVSQS